METNPAHHRPTLSSERPFPPARPGERGEGWSHGTKIKWYTPAYLDRLRREWKAAVADGKPFVFVDEEKNEEEEREEEEVVVEEPRFDPYGLRALQTSRARDEVLVGAVGGEERRPLTPVIEEEEEEEEERAS